MKFKHPKLAAITLPLLFVFPHLYSLAWRVF